MKKIQKVSVLLNVILLAGMLLLWRNPKTVTILMPEPPQTAPTSIRQTVVAPFRWNQLLSSNDYRSFVTNLRKAGCPETTVEDIVRGNTGRAYSVMRTRLNVNPADKGPWSAQAEVQMAAYFLGQAPAPTPEPARQPPIPSLVTTPPLVLQNVDLSTMKLDDAQTQAIANIRETFWNSVGAANQDTNDPAYLARWQKAEYQADATLQAMLGGTILCPISGASLSIVASKSGDLGELTKARKGSRRSHCGAEVMRC
ncbi:MAG TPA: hypothetical protein VGJ73_00750 [Verrucomicrobiae bacterium]|jgi:hypothetical protein